MDNLKFECNEAGRAENFKAPSEFFIIFSDLCECLLRPAEDARKCLHDVCSNS